MNIINFDKHKFEKWRFKNSNCCSLKKNIPEICISMFLSHFWIKSIRLLYANLLYSTYFVYNHERIKLDFYNNKIIAYFDIMNKSENCFVRLLWLFYHNVFKPTYAFNSNLHRKLDPDCKNCIKMNWTHFVLALLFLNAVFYIQNHFFKYFT